MTQDTEATVRRFLDAYNAHDLDAVMGVFAQDAVYNDIGMGSRHEGIEAVRGYIDSAFSVAPDCHWKALSIIAADDRAALEGNWSGTVTLPGVDEPVPWSIEAATIIDVRDGLITSLVDYHKGAAG